MASDICNNWEASRIGHNVLVSTQSMPGCKYVRRCSVWYVLRVVMTNVMLACLWFLTGTAGSGAFDISREIS